MQTVAMIYSRIAYYKIEVWIWIIITMKKAKYRSALMTLLGQ